MTSSSAGSAMAVQPAVPLSSGPLQMWRKMQEPRPGVAGMLWATMTPQR